MKKCSNCCEAEAVLSCIQCNEANEENLFCNDCAGIHITLRDSKKHVFEMRTRFCWNCEEEGIVSTHRCTKCVNDAQYLCSSCASNHGRIKHFKDHRVVEIDDGEKEEEQCQVGAREEETTGAAVAASDGYLSHSTSNEAHHDQSSIFHLCSTDQVEMKGVEQETNDTGDDASTTGTLVDSDQEHEKLNTKTVSGDFESSDHESVDQESLELTDNFVVGRTGLTTVVDVKILLGIARPSFVGRTAHFPDGKFKGQLGRIIGNYGPYYFMVLLDSQLESTGEQDRVLARPVNQEILKRIGIENADRSTSSHVSIDDDNRWG